MTIALSRTTGFKGYRYDIRGQISPYADWTQSLNVPADGATVTLTGHDVRITFRESAEDTAAVLSLNSEVTVSDADTLAIDVPSASLTGLTCERYVVDITSNDGSDNITHWAHGIVRTPNSPITFA